MPASPIPYANDLDIAPDGTIYFTDSSHFGPALHPQLGFFDTLRACVLTMAQVLPGRAVSGHMESRVMDIYVGGGMPPVHTTPSFCCDAHHHVGVGAPGHSSMSGLAHALLMSGQGLSRGPAHKASGLRCAMRAVGLLLTFLALEI